MVSLSTEIIIIMTFEPFLDWITHTGFYNSLRLIIFLIVLQNYEKSLMSDHELIR